MRFEALMARVELMATTLNKVTQGVPTTQVQVVVGGWLAFGTFVLYAILAIRATAIDAMAFGLWLGFVAACLGIAYKQFHAKRTTDYGYLERQNGHASPPPSAEPKG